MSMSNGICDRCGKVTNSFTTSMFNLDDLCMDCLAKEQQHPMYKRAKEVEHQHVVDGDYNFPGIGKPNNL